MLGFWWHERVNVNQILESKTGASKCRSHNSHLLLWVSQVGHRTKLSGVGPEVAQVIILQGNFLKCVLFGDGPRGQKWVMWHREVKVGHHGCEWHVPDFRKLGSFQFHSLCRLESQLSHTFHHELYHTPNRADLSVPLIYQMGGGKRKLTLIQSFQFHWYTKWGRASSSTHYITT